MFKFTMCQSNMKKIITLFILLFLHKYALAGIDQEPPSIIVMYSSIKKFTQSEVADIVLNITKENSCLPLEMELGATLDRKTELFCVTYKIPPCISEVSVLASNFVGWAINRSGFCRALTCDGDPGFSVSTTSVDGLVSSSLPRISGKFFITMVFSFEVWDYEAYEHWMNHIKAAIDHMKWKVVLKQGPETSRLYAHIIINVVEFLSVDSETRKLFRLPINFELMKFEDALSGCRVNCKNYDPKNNSNSCTQKLNIRKAVCNRTSFININKPHQKEISESLNIEDTALIYINDGKKARVITIPMQSYEDIKNQEDAVKPEDSSVESAVDLADSFSHLNICNDSGQSDGNDRERLKPMLALFFHMTDIGFFGAQEKLQAIDCLSMFLKSGGYEVIKSPADDLCMYHSFANFFNANKEEKSKLLATDYYKDHDKESDVSGIDLYEYSKEVVAILISEDFDNNTEAYKLMGESFCHEGTRGAAMWGDDNIIRHVFLPLIERIFLIIIIEREESTAWSLRGELYLGQNQVNLLCSEDEIISAINTYNPIVFLHDQMHWQLILKKDNVNTPCARHKSCTP
ncbi:MAG: hypothetical protein QS721_08145 [Candidatus Endonucleobacter sp. (ex Gigantidas childressi)]|nr:hypothetical protein [Candidatus Endonucleobacter sp. (ex Gigantidas childressi)]